MASGCSHHLHHRPAKDDVLRSLPAGTPLISKPFPDKGLTKIGREAALAHRVSALRWFSLRWRELETSSDPGTRIKAKSSRGMPGSIWPFTMRRAMRRDASLPWAGLRGATRPAPQAIRLVGRLVRVQPRPIPQLGIGQIKGKQSVLHSCVRHGLPSCRITWIVPSILLPLLRLP